MLTCGKLSARLSWRWVVAWSQWLSEGGSGGSVLAVMPARAQLLTEDGRLTLASLSKNLRGSLVTQKKACVLGGLPGTAVLFFPLPPGE